MKVPSAHNTSLVIIMSTFVLLFVTTFAAPVDSDEEELENTLVAHPDNELYLPGTLDAMDTAALRKLLLQLDAEISRMGRVSRTWPQTEPRGWGLRNIDGRLARQWRADKRQVRFRQCYFNPISCFRK